MSKGAVRGSEIKQAVVMTPILQDERTGCGIAAVMFGDPGKLNPSDRNVLRQMFTDSRVRSAQHDWESVARQKT